MKNKKLKAIIQLVLGIGATLGLMLFRGNNGMPIATKMIVAACAIAAALIVIKLLDWLKVVDLKDWPESHAHSKNVNKLPQAKIAIGVALVGLVLPMFVGGWFFSNQSPTNPRVWVLDGQKITSWSLALGISLILSGLIVSILILRWTEHWFVRVFHSILILIGIGFFWTMYLIGQPPNLIFVSWALGMLIFISYPALTYRLYLEKVTPRDLDTTHEGG